MFCENCGKQIEDDSKFCEHCGAEVKKINTSGEDNKVDSFAVITDDKNLTELKNEKNTKDKNKIPIIIISIVGALVIVALVIIFAVIQPQKNKDKSIKSDNSENYSKAENNNQKTEEESESVVETQETTNQNAMYSYVDELLVRTGPGREYEAIGKLYLGDQVEVIGTQDVPYNLVNDVIVTENWTNIKYNGQNAWVYSEYLTKLNKDYISAILSTEPFASHIKGGIGMKPDYKGEDDTYVYCKISGGGGWWWRKIQKVSPYSVSEMNNDEIARYEDNPYNPLNPLNP